MKITCTVENLRNAVLTAERFTGKHITLPILSYLLFKVKDRRILINATNLEVGVEYIIPGKVEKGGEVIIPARSLSQIIQTLQDDIVTIEANQHHSILNTSSTKVTLLGLNPGDFPSLPSIKKEHFFNVATGDLVSSLERVISAVATSDFKPELSGVFMSVTSSGLTIAATDSFRLAERTLNHKAGVQNKIECIIPGRTALEVIRVGHSLAESNVAVTIGEHQIILEWESLRIVSRLIDGSYPPYKNLVPKAFEANVVVDREDFLKKIRLASVFSSRLNDVTLKFSPHQLEVTTANADSGSTTAHLAVKGRGLPGAVMFNHRYLADGLEGAGGTNIVLSLNGVSGPAMIQNPDDSTFFYLIMPIRST